MGNSSPHFGGHWCVFFKVDWRSKLGNMGRKRDCYVSFRDSTHLDTSLLKVNLRQIYVLTVNCCYNRASQTNVHVGLRQGKLIYYALNNKKFHHSFAFLAGKVICSKKKANKVVLFQERRKRERERHKLLNRKSLKQFSES